MIADTIQTPQYFARSPDEFGGKIPFIVTDLIAQLNKMDCKNHEGIFRISGSARDIAELAYELNQNRITDWSPYIQNIHTISGTLKKYFRELVSTDPLLPYEHFKEMTDIPDKYHDDNSMAQAFKTLFDKISVPRRLTFQVLCQFLSSIATCEKSKMTANNLAIVFAPSLLSPSSEKLEPEQIIEVNKKENKAIESLIRLTDKVFGSAPVDERYLITDQDLSILEAPPLSEIDLPTLLEMREIRKKSLIPFIPYNCLITQDFTRPFKPYTQEKEK